MVIWNKHTAN